MSSWSALPFIFPAATLSSCITLFPLYSLLLLCPLVLLSSLYIPCCFYVLLFSLSHRTACFCSVLVSHSLYIPCCCSVFLFLFLCSCFQMFLFSSVPVSLFLFSDVPVFQCSSFQCSCFSVPVFRCSCYTVPVSLCFSLRCSCFPFFLFSSVPVFQCSCSSVSAVRTLRPVGLGCVDGTKTVASWSYLWEKTGYSLVHSDIQVCTYHTRQN